MKKTILSILVLSVVIVTVGSGYAQEMGIITGNKRGT